MLAALGAHLRPHTSTGINTLPNNGDGVPVVEHEVTVVAKQHPTSTGLSMEETKDYERHGLVVPAARLSPSTTAALQDLLLRTLAVTCSADPPVEMPIAPNCPTNLYGAHGPAIPAGVAAKWMALCRHPAILDRVESVLGPDIILWGNQLFHKPAETGLEVPWHQDGRYWPIHPPASCSVWVAIDEATEANGAMGWVRSVHRSANAITAPTDCPARCHIHRGSHASSTLFHHNTDDDPELALHQVLDLNAAGLSEDCASLNLLPAGGFSLHDVYLVHNSRPNKSLKRRAGYVMRYMPASSLFDPSRLPGDLGDVKNSNAANFSRPIFLVRGSARDNIGYPGLVDATPQAGAPDPSAILAAADAVRGLY